MNIARTSALVITVALLSSTVLAGGVHQNSHRAQRLLARFDSNHDGVLDASELEAIHQFRQQRHFRKLKRFDSNGNGQFDPMEKQAMNVARARRQAEMLKRFDTNRNGQLDPNEKQAAKGSVLHTRANQRYDRMLGRFDSNHDGTLSLDEVSGTGTRYRHTGTGTRRTRGEVSGTGTRRTSRRNMQERFRAADQNNDGLVTRSEFVQTVKQRLHTRMQHQQRNRDQ